MSSKDGNRLTGIQTTTALTVQPQWPSVHLQLPSHKLPKRVQTDLMPLRDALGFVISNAERVFQEGTQMLTNLREIYTNLDSELPRTNFPALPYLPSYMPTVAPTVAPKRHYRRRKAKVSKKVVKSTKPTSVMGRPVGYRFVKKQCPNCGRQVAFSEATQQFYRHTENPISGFKPTKSQAPQVPITTTA